MRTAELSCEMDLDFVLLPMNGYAIYDYMCVCSRVCWHMCVYKGATCARVWRLEVGIKCLPFSALNPIAG